MQRNERMPRCFSDVTKDAIDFANSVTTDKLVDLAEEDIAHDLGHLRTYIEIGKDLHRNYP